MCRRMEDARPFIVRFKGGFCIMCSFQIIEPSSLHDIVRPFGPSPPLGGDGEGRGGVFPRPLGRFYGFLNDYGIPLAFRKPYNLASLVEMHPLWCLRHHLSPGGGTGPMDLSLSDKAIFKNTSQENRSGSYTPRSMHHTFPHRYRDFSCTRLSNFHHTSYLSRWRPSSSRNAWQGSTSL